MAKAVWENTVLAESDDCVVIENNYYFPPESLKMEYFKESDTHSVCSWKGKASYFDIEVGGEVNKDAAWYYPSPKVDASKIKDYVAFWKEVEVH